FIKRYAPGAAPETAPILDRLVECAVAYYRDFVKPAKKYRKATPEEAKAFADLADGLKKLPHEAGADDIQNLVYEIGKREGFPELKAWFKACYEVLLGQEQGPRMGSFIKLYGLAESIALLEKAARGEDME
ncbi:MAG: lysine--tRNA ligase, partial [Actinomycetota bacterium]